MNSLLKHVIEGNIERITEMKRKRGIKHEQLPDDLKEREDTVSGKRKH
jgi:hypothetical protein